MIKKTLFSFLLASLLVSQANATTVVQIGSAPLAGANSGARDVIAKGSILIVADGSDGLAMVDVSDKSNPLLLSTRPTATAAMAITEYGNRAYVTLEGVGVLILDITNPASPDSIGFFPNVMLTLGPISDAVAVDSSSPTIIYVIRNNVVGLLRQVDVSDPSVPVVLKHYVGTSFVGNPQALAMNSAGGIYSGNDDPSYAVVSYNTIKFNNITFDTSYSQNREVHDIETRNSLIYAAEGVGFIQILDRSLQLISTIGSFGATPFLGLNGTWLIGSSETDLEVWDVSDSSSVVAVGYASFTPESTMGGNPLLVRTPGNYAYVPSGDSLRVFLIGCCTTPGDANSDGSMNITDVTFLTSRIFSQGPAPLCADQADANGDGSVNVADVTFLIARIFTGGPEPICGQSGS